MQIKELENKELFRKFKVTIPVAKVDTEINSKATEIAKNAKIDGFRPGKVPASVIKQKHKDSLKSEVLESLVKSASKEIVTKNKFELSGAPKIENLDFKPGKDLEFEVEMELLPEIKEFDTKKIKLEKKLASISDKEINESIDKLRQDNKELVALPKDKAAKNGDAVLIDAVGSMDGKEFPEGKVTDKQLTLGAGEFIPGFEEGLVGTKAGDEKKLNLAFPKEYWKKELAGKKVVFDVKVKEVSKVELPAIDDKLAQKFKLKDLKELKSKIEDSIVKYYDDISVNILKKDLFDYLDKEIKFTVPAKLLEREMEFLKQNSEKSEKADKTNEKIASRRVKIGLILSDLAKRRKLSISQEEIQAEIATHLRSMPGHEQAILDYYKNNPQALESIRGKVLEDKSVDLLIKEATVTEKKVTSEELSNLFKAIK